MEQLWSAETLRSHWVLRSQEQRLLKGLPAQKRLVLGYYLKFFQRYARFPGLTATVPEAVAQFLAEQIGYEGPLPSHVPERSDRRYRRLVSAHLRLGRFGQEASARFLDWLITEILPDAPQMSALDAQMTAWFLANRIVRPNQPRLNKLTVKAERRFERMLCTMISQRLSPQHKRDLDALLSTDEAMSQFAMLARSPNGASVQSVQDGVMRLDVARDIGLPASLFGDIHPEYVATFARRAASEDAWDMRRRPEAVRYALLSCFCATKTTELTDDLGDLVISITHKISARAESKVIKEYVADFRKIESKDSLLGKIVVAIDGQP